jgi:hypothetical protein
LSCALEILEIYSTCIPLWINMLRDVDMHHTPASGWR